MIDARARSASFGLAMPALHVLGVGAQVCAGLEEPVVEVEVEVVGLDVVHDEHRRHRPRELAERVEDVLRLRGDAGFERLVVDLGAAPRPRAVRPGAGGFGVERRLSWSYRKPSPGTSGLPEAPSMENRSIPSNIQPPRPIACNSSTP